MPKDKLGGQRGRTNGGTIAQAQPVQQQQPSTSQQRTVTKASEAQDMNELRTYAQDQLGVEINQNVDNSDFALIQKAISDYEYLKAEFPKWDGTVESFVRKDFASDSTNAATDGVNIKLSKWYEDPAGFAQRVAQAEAIGYYPKNTTNMSTAMHELGHTFEQALINKYLPKTGTFLNSYDRVEAWNNHTYSRKLISEACKIAKKMPEGKGKKNDGLIAQVSKYATRTRGETLAECVRDYSINGNNAQPLSRAVWQILKREFG